VQFGKSSQHFEVVSPSFAAADGGAPGNASKAPRRIELEYSVESTVCAAICDRVYELPLFQAVRLRNDQVSKHAKATLTLDCRGKGDHAKCGKDDPKDIEPAPIAKEDAAMPSLSEDASQAVETDASTPSDTRDASVREIDASEPSGKGDSGSSLQSLDPTGVWVSDYDCGAGDYYWVVWEITAAGTAGHYTISDGQSTPYDAMLSGRTLAVTRADLGGGATDGTLIFPDGDDDHFSGTFTEGTKNCTETGRRSPQLSVTGSGPACSPSGASNLPDCTNICDAASTCGAACNCATAVMNGTCAARYTVWQNCVDAERITTPAFVCPNFEPETHCWAEWDLCVADTSVTCL
jgi:hypothetical protein